ncbi:MAG TPA: 50S ribosomal protein L21 [Alphaproteobacteria bacterium]|nr:50S ribosomal protein L21 [Alphaproteobacteria bacterium]
MYAVIQTGGKQYKVAQNDVIVVEKLPAASGDTVEFGEVLMVADGAKRAVGAPWVAGALVIATVLDQGKGDKIIVFKKKRRKNYRRKNGHRQFHTVLRISGIYTDGARPAAEAKAAPVPKAAKKKSAKAPARKKAAKAKE